MNYLLKNYIYIKNQEFIDFTDKALNFYNFLQEENKEKYDPKYFISRPYAYQMTREFAEGLGLDLSIMDRSEYFSNIFRLVFLKDTRYELLPHIDTFPGGGFMPAAVNFPLLGCNDSVKTQWWRIKSGQPAYTINKGGEINSYVTANSSLQSKECELELIDEVSMQDRKPVLFRTSRWHSAVNNTGNIRIMAGIIFKPTMIWEDICMHCKEKEWI